MKRKLQDTFKKAGKKWRFGKIARLFLITTLLFAGVAATAFQLAYKNKIYPGITIASLSVGNRTINEANLRIKTQTLSPETKKITLVYGEQEREINLDDLELKYQTNQTVQKAYRLGRSGHPLKDFEIILRAWFSGHNLDLDYSLNQALLDDQIATIASQIYIPPIEPQIKVIDQTIKVEPGQEGLELNHRKLIMQIGSRLSRLDFSPLSLPVNQLAFRLSPKEVEKTQQRAQKILGNKLVFVYGDQQWELKNNEVVQFLSFTNGFDQEKIASQTANLASVIDRAPEDATFQFAEGRVTEFRPAKEGQKLDQEKTQQLIKTTLEEIENRFLPNEKPVEKIINLPVLTTPPKITVDQINNLGIKELIGKGLSNFRGSIPSRVHNLVLASSKLNGVLIPPGEVFSFLDSLGEVSPATGYQSAFVIKEGKTILDDGGGVCQVSTTFFRAALNTGLPILERHPHSYRVVYYEQGGFGPGLDATVWIPSVDLKIKNDTPAHILIQTYANTKTNTLTFEFYGTDDGRQITLSKPKIWDQTPPPPDLYQDDPTLPAGTVKQIERANWGAKVSIDWQVTRKGENLWNRTFYSHYQPWQAVYLRGTGPVQL